MVKKKKKKGKEKIVISTLMGDTELNPDDPVLIQVNKGNFITKRAEEISEGDKVVYDRSKAKNTLDQIEGHLLEVDRYKRARDFLFETIQNQDVTKLRSLLSKGAHDLSTNGGDLLRDFLQDASLFERRGATALSRLSPHDLEDRLATDSFSRDEKIFITHLTKHSLDTANGNSRSLGQIYNWCSGPQNSDTITIAPSNWELFEILSAIHQELGQFAVDYANRHNIEGHQALETNRYHNYKFYVGVRQRIMRAAAKPGSFNVSQEDETDLKSLTPFIRVLERAFISPINDRYSSPKVTGIKRVRRRGQTPEDLVGGVVVTNQSPGEEMNLIRINYFSDYMIMVSAMAGILYHYASENKDYGLTHPDFYQGLAEYLCIHLSRGKNQFGEVDSDRSLPGFDKENSTRIANELLRDIESGKFDEVMGFRKVYMVDIAEALQTIVRAEPREYDELRSAIDQLENPQTSEKEKRRADRRVDELVEKLKRKYDYNYVNDLPWVKRVDKFIADELRPGGNERLDDRAKIMGWSGGEPIPVWVNNKEMVMDSNVVLYPAPVIHGCLSKFGLGKLYRFVDVRKYAFSALKKENSSLKPTF
ncbi:hypothetical protein ACFLZB_02775 [Nanoarchaeota archaeon]